MTNNGVRYGEPGWKPLSETRHATITVRYEVDCSQCEAGSHGGLYLKQFTTLDQAKEYQAEHDAKHRIDVAECCMHATGVVCSCGKVLV
jgi:hypothetical protein